MAIVAESCIISCTPGMYMCAKIYINFQVTYSPLSYIYHSKGKVQNSRVVLLLEKLVVEKATPNNDIKTSLSTLFTHTHLYQFIFINLQQKINRHSLIPTLKNNLSNIIMMTTSIPSSQILQQQIFP